MINSSHLGIRHSVPTRASIVSAAAFFIVIALAARPGFAQLYEIGTAQKVASSTLIVEGKVTDSYSFWNVDHTLIFTSNLVKVSKVFHGSMTGGEIEIVTKGGRIGYDIHSHSHNLELQAGDLGFFFCEETPVRNSGRKFNGDRRVQVFSSEQGFIAYNMTTRTASDPFHIYNSIDNGLYAEVMALTGASYRALMPLQDLVTPVAPFKGPRMSAAPTITSFTPTSVHGGTRDVIVITGTNFGATRGTGTVGFKNADDGGATYINPDAYEYVSWTNTEIRVQIPDRAGTGTIQVTNSDPATATSASTLTVTYSILTNTYAAWTRRLNLINDNGNGGYSFRMQTDFDGNASARASFLRAFVNWRCSTSTNNGINWDLGPTTTTDVTANDGVNVVRFDNGSELAAGVLGQCSRYTSAGTCATPDTIAWVVELDMTYDDGTSWYYGTGTPGGSQVDFESVSLHELGHGHQLAHVIDAAAVMHYALAAGATKRVLSANDLAAGNNVLTYSMAASICSIAKMNAIAANAGTDTTICPGGSASLLARGGVTYSWAPATGLSATNIPNPVATPAATTTYTVSVTNGTCLAASDPVTVTVTSGAPAVSAGADKSICVGDSAIIGTADASKMLGTISSGSSSNSTLIFNTAVEDEKTQIMLLKTDLNTAGITGPCYISKIAWQFTSITNTKAMSNFLIGMKNTTATNFSSSLQTVTTVLSLASYTPDLGWDTLQLDTPFLWDGNSNLVVQACFDNTGSPSTSGYATTYTIAGSATCAFNSSSGACTITTSWSATTARPNVRLIASPYKFAWSPTTGLRFPNDANPKASPGSTQAYTVTLTDTYGCTSSDATTVTVYPTNPTTLTWTGAVNTNWSTVGNWDAPCAVPTAGDVVIIPTAVTPPAGIPAMTLGGLTINNAAGTALSGDLSVTGTTTLTAGDLSLGSYNLTVGSAGSIAGGSASSYILTNGTGELRQANIGTAGRTGTITFPLGAAASSYTPLALSNTGTADEFRVRVSGSVLTAGTTGTPITADVVTRTWHVSEAMAGGSTASLTMQWNAAEEGTGFSRTSCQISRYTGTGWVLQGSMAAASGSGPYTRAVTGMSSFGPFGITDNASVLPVELVAFSATRKDNGVVLIWRTQSEFNNLYFQVQRSEDPRVSWTEIGRVDGHGTSDEPFDYRFFDAHASSDARLYYRLVQTDRDGSLHPSAMVMVDSETRAGVELRQNYPNPFQSGTEISFALDQPRHAILRVYDACGRVIATLADETLEAGFHTRLFDASRLPEGMYFAVLQTGAARVTRIMTILR
jgi:hypothetical protein